MKVAEGRRLCEILNHTHTAHLHPLESQRCVFKARDKSHRRAPNLSLFICRHRMYDLEWTEKTSLVTSHFTRHFPLVTSHFTRHFSLVTSHFTRHFSLVTSHLTSHLSLLTSHLTRHFSLVTSHLTSHLSLLTSHFTRHFSFLTSHLTSHSPTVFLHHHILVMHQPCRFIGGGHDEVASAVIRIGLNALCTELDGFRCATRLYKAVCFASEGGRDGVSVSGGCQGVGARRGTS